MLTLTGSSVPNWSRKPITWPSLIRSPCLYWKLKLECSTKILETYAETYKVLMYNILLYNLEAVSFLLGFCPFGMIQPAIRSITLVCSTAKVTGTTGPVTRTVGEATRTYPLAPEASNAANFLDFSTGIFVNGFVFPAEVFVGEAAGEAGVDSAFGAAGTGAGATGGAKATGASMFLLRCISKSPIC